MESAWSRRDLLLGTASIAVGMRSASAQASGLRIVCVGPPGSTPDAIARAYADALATHFAGGVIVEGRPGGSGVIAVAALRQAAADGRTLLLGHGGLVTSFPHVYAKLAYDPDRDLVPVALAAETAFAFVLGPLVPAEVTSLGAFIEWARANPREMNCGMPGGIGAPTHLIAADFFRAARIVAQFVPYASGPALIGDLLGAQLAAGVLPEGLIRPWHESGRLRAVVTTGEVPSEILGRVPTLSAARLSTVPGREWFGFFAPAGTDPTLIEELSRRIRDVSRTAAQAGRFDAVALKALIVTPDEMRERIASERQAWKPLVAALGLKLE